MALFSIKKTIYYPGNTLTKYAPELVLNWKSILSDFGIQFEIQENFNSGWALWDQGYQEEYNLHKTKLAKYFQKNNIKQVITSSPEAAYILKKHHDIQVKHTTEIVFEHLNKVQQFNEGQVAWHDNTTQVRRNNIINQPRRILLKAGFEIQEFSENKQETQCLGTSTGLINNSPRLAAKLALRRAKLAPSKTIITDSPEDYLHLKRNTSHNILELSEVLVEI